MYLTNRKWQLEKIVKPEKVNLLKQVSIWYSITMFFEKRFFSENFQHLKIIIIVPKPLRYKEHLQWCSVCDPAQ